MPLCLAAADLVICRAGAITLSELQAQGKASILIPSPNVAENHQYHNAMALVNQHAASILEEKDLSGEALIRRVEELFKDPKTIAELGNHAKKWQSLMQMNESIQSFEDCKLSFTVLEYPIVWNNSARNRRTSFICRGELRWPI